jgi:hypothetical protein
MFQEFPCLSGNSKFHYQVQRSQPLILVTSHLNSVYNLTIYIFTTHFNIIHHIEQVINFVDKSEYFVATSITVQYIWYKLLSNSKLGLTVIEADKVTPDQSLTERRNMAFGSVPCKIFHKLKWMIYHGITAICII